MKIAARTKGFSRASPIFASTLVVLILCGLYIVTSLGSLSPLCDEDESVAMAGGLMGAPKEVKSSENSAEIEGIAKFAVEQHNTKEVCTERVSVCPRLLLSIVCCCCPIVSSVVCPDRVPNYLVSVPFTLTLDIDGKGWLQVTASVSRLHH